MEVSGEEVCVMMVNLNRNLLIKYMELKNHFTKQPPPNHQIMSCLKEWKSQFQQIIQHSLTFLSTQDHTQPDQYFSELALQMIREYAQHQQFVEALKNVNSTIETIKDFMRTNAIKDPASQISS